MKKQMVVCLAAAAVMMLVTGCGTKEDRTTLHIKDGGKVVENITEDFNQDNYDEKELKTFIEQQIEDYKKESGNSVKSGGFAVEEGKAYLTVKFDDTKTYSDFNDETLYQGTVVEAVADGYTFPEHFYPVKDGKLKKKATDKNIDGDDSYKVVITSESVDVAVSGKVAYVSGNNVKIKDEKTVSIQKENADDTSLTYIVYK